jgi:hypothetical protein
VDGAGVAASGITYHAGNPVLSDAQIAATAAVTGTATLQESNFSNAYTVVARVVDRVGNQALVRLAPSAGNPSTMFGVDKVAPAFVFNEPASLPEGAVNPAALVFATTPSDSRSGFSATPVVHRIFGNFTASLCFLGGVECAPVLGGTIVAAAALDGFYFTYEARVRDQAGNESAAITRTVIVDHQIPEVITMSLPAPLTGGAPTQFSASLADNVDLRSAQHRLDFPQFSGQSESLPFAPPTPIDNFGAPQTTTQSVFQSIDFVRSLELTTAGNAPSGVLQATQGTRFTVHDQAGNVRSFGALFPGGAVPPGSSAGAVDLNVQTFRITSPNLPTSLCPAQPCGAAQQSISLSVDATGPAGTFNNPFGRGVFFFWVDATGTTQLIARSQAPLADESGGVRTWTWTVSFSAPNAQPQLNVPIFAIGVDSQGDGLRTAVNTNVVIITPGG